MPSAIAQRVTRHRGIPWTELIDGWRTGTDEGGRITVNRVAAVRGEDLVHWMQDMHGWTDYAGNPLLLAGSRPYHLRRYLPDRHPPPWPHLYCVSTDFYNPLGYPIPLPASFEFEKVKMVATYKSLDYNVGEFFPPGTSEFHRYTVRTEDWDAHALPIAKGSYEFDGGGDIPEPPPVLIGGGTLRIKWLQIPVPTDLFGNPEVDIDLRALWDARIGTTNSDVFIQAGVEKLLMLEPAVEFYRQITGDWAMDVTFRISKRGYLSLVNSPHWNTLFRSSTGLHTRVKRKGSAEGIYKTSAFLSLFPLSV